MNQKEIWKQVKGYEGIYEVSTLGKIKNSKRNIIKKPYKDKYGYFLIQLWSNNKSLTTGLHRIIAQAFIPNPQNKPQINHKNGIRDDNRIENLEWCTVSENHKHSFRELGRKGHSNMKGRKGKLHPKSRPVIQKTLDGKIINKYGSVLEAQRYTHIQESSIRSVCYGKYKHAGGYLWEYD